MGGFPNHGWILLAAGVFMLSSAIAFWRWFRRKPKRVKVPSELFEEMTRFAEELGQLEDNIGSVADELGRPGKRVWRKTSRRILKRLRSVNYLLEHLNKLFEEEHVRGSRWRRKRPVRDPETLQGEHRRFRDMAVISDEEICEIDWEEFNKRLLG